MQINIFKNIDLKKNRTQKFISLIKYDNERLYFRYLMFVLYISSRLNSPQCTYYISRLNFHKLSNRIFVTLGE